MHLTQHTQRLLLDGRLDPAEARTLAAHLETGCSICESALSASRADGVDGMVDVALTRLAPLDPSDAGNDLEYARIRRRARSPRRVAWRGLGMGALAAGLVVAVAGGLLLVRGRAVTEPRWDGVKGVVPTAAAPPVRLSAVSVLAGRGEDPPFLRKVGRGDLLPDEAILQFQLEVGGASELALARVGRSGEVELFWQGRATEAGKVLLLAADGRPAGYPLAELSGPQRLVAVASVRRLTERQATAVAGAVAAGRPAEGFVRPQRISVDVLEFTIR
jgi:hypothetical protein